MRFFFGKHGAFPIFFKRAKMSRESESHNFITHLNNLEDDFVLTACRAEVLRIRSQYTRATAKVMFSYYRNPFYGADSISWKRGLTFDQFYQKVKAECEGREGEDLRGFVICSLFKLSVDEYDVHNSAYKKQVVVGNSELKSVDHVEYIKTAKAMIASNRPMNKILGLLAVTGRRTSEIISTGSFHPTGNEFSADFEGQLKTRDKDAAPTYEIPLLIEYDQVVSCLEDIRGYFPDIEKVSPEEINLRYSKQLARCMGAFKATVGADKLMVKDLRKIYAAIAYLLHGQTKMGQSAYIGSILGHSSGDNDTAASYITYAAY